MTREDRAIALIQEASDCFTEDERAYGQRKLAEAIRVLQEPDEQRQVGKSATMAQTDKSS
jgi:hypothetical protein